MDYYSINRREEQKDKFKSGMITLGIWAALLLFVFLYKITHVVPAQNEVVSAMLINFGDNRNGDGLEEPAEQEGSMAALSDLQNPDPVSQSAIETPAPEVREKIITGNNSKNTTAKVDKISKTTEKPVAKKTATSKTTGSKATTANATKGSGDGKGTAAVGNLLRGRGTKAGSQGTNGTTGNAGDPLGGDGDGDSRIGVDRKLVGFIPGTMGRGGAQPVHNCKASGTISISYTVDQAGNVTSASRSGGISDGCVVSTSVSWVKKYVKAERASTSSSGTYRITF
ncbi:ferric siderophore ABC transporter substrate-binding protein [Chryseobacterium sp. MFBS3-17]|uniref:ferric siderophore ABC transporter substrate-binding protein n=1 Tax=Chryseobacterium sp. MFBS3-17 TaxID=2886689 RepID=UPI001D0E6762|nr:ferric siderophore ABC transporter substrate-binding protein [Chryseobacterium sp. MFBS3-17]MCC2591164.1 ferric siderophore ABC transporter substrate-binding protein [Chryseobacterium sp. MFBS3-17]